MMQATLLRDVPHRCAVVQEEVFGPVAVLQRFTSFDDALHHVNDSRFGLQAGLHSGYLQGPEGVGYA